MLFTLKALVSCTSVALVVCASDTSHGPGLTNERIVSPDHTNHPDHDADRHDIAAVGNYSAVQGLIHTTGSDIFHLDLNRRGEWQNPDGNGITKGQSGEAQPPWFEGFGGGRSAATAFAAAATVGHPIRRMLAYLQEEDVGLDTALSWMEGQGVAAGSSNHYRKGYQFVDNYMVRVLAGKSAWELPPGGVGNTELLAARIALGKFEVLLREDCLSVDLPLLRPYLEQIDGPVDMPSDIRNFYDKAGVFLLPPGDEGQYLVRANRWDLQLWNFANWLVKSRSTTLESYLCGSGELKRAQSTPGKGRRAVVYNSPSFHLTGVSMFSCVLMSWGFQVTAVLQTPVPGFEQLLPCAHQVIALQEPVSAAALNFTAPLSHELVLNSTVVEMLGLPPRAQSQEQSQLFGRWVGARKRKPPERGGKRRKSRRELASSEEKRGTGNISEHNKKANGDNETKKRGGGGLFDVSVLCTAYRDLNVLFDFHGGVDPRLAGAFLWNVTTSIWNIHDVTRIFQNGGIPPIARNFAAGLPLRQGKFPPPTFLTVYGEHVAGWEESIEEAYEGWEKGPSPLGDDRKRKKKSNLRGLFPTPGVVYPILPTGTMRLLRPNSRLISFDEKKASGGQESMTLGKARRVNFIVQGTMDFLRRDYKTLLGCLEAMCLNGRDNYSIEAVGSYGDLKEELEAHPCTFSRYTESRALEYENFYARISNGDFVVTATAGDDYEYDRATSSVPTALLLERPLVMGSSLLDSYPCLRRSRVHSMVANDDLCLNLHAAYDLTPSEYDEMELEARDCKLDMWRQTRKTVADIILKGNGNG